MSLVATWKYETDSGATDGQEIFAGSNGVIDTIGHPKYSSAGAVHGGAGKLGVACSAATGSTELFYVNPNTAAMTGSVYGAVTTAPVSGAKTAFIKFTQSAHTGDTRASISLLVDGSMVIADLNGAVLATASAIWTLNQTMRIDWQIKWTSGTPNEFILDVRIFLGPNFEGSIADSTMSATFQASAPAWIGIGTSQAAWSTTFDTLRLYDDRSAWPVAFNPGPTGVLTTHTYDGEGASNNDPILQGKFGVTNITGVPKYSTSADVHGTFGVSASGVAAVYYASPNTLGMTGSVYGAVTTVPASGRTVFIKFTDNALATKAQIALGPTGGIYISDSGGVAKATSIVSWTINQNMRIDWQALWDGTNITLTVHIFLSGQLEGTAPDDTMTASFVSAEPTKIGFGNSQATWSTTFDTVRLYNQATPTSWLLPYSPAAPAVLHMWGGGPTQTGFTVVSRTTGTTSLRLAVSTSSSMSSPVYVSAQTPDVQGYTRHVLSTNNLTQTRYYQLANTPTGGSESLIGPVGKIKLLKAAGSAQNFTVALGSCQRNDSTVSAALDDIVSWDPDFMLHVGDFHYQSSVSPDKDVHKLHLARQIQAAAGLKTLARRVPMFYTNSDHEAGPDNGDSDTVWAQAFNDAYKDVVPYASLADTRDPLVGKYQSWVVGRVRFIMIDVRNHDRSHGDAIDNSSKTMLGATQKAWLLARLSDSEPLKVIVCDVPWMGDPRSDLDYVDKWQSYNTERTEIGKYITDNGINVDFWHGDSHFLGADGGNGDTSHNLWGGFPVICGSPFDNVAGSTDSGYFKQFWNNMGSDCSQYMRITFTDNGTTITRTASAWDALGAAGAGVERFSQVKTWSTSPGLGAAKVWNGSSWVSSPAKTWDGTTWVANTTKTWDGTSWVDSNS